MAAWALAGLGHCSSEPYQSLETSLQLCLQRCQESSRCLFASFVDTVYVKVRRNRNLKRIEERRAKEGAEMAEMAEMAEEGKEEEAAEEAAAEPQAAQREGEVASTAALPLRRMGWGHCRLFASCPGLVSQAPGFATFAKRSKPQAERRISTRKNRTVTAALEGAVRRGVETSVETSVETEKRPGWPAAEDREPGQFWGSVSKAQAAPATKAAKVATTKTSTSLPLATLAVSPSMADSVYGLCYRCHRQLCVDSWEDGKDGKDGLRDGLRDGTARLRLEESCTTPTLFEVRSVRSVQRRHRAQAEGQEEGQEEGRESEERTGSPKRGSPQRSSSKRSSPSQVVAVSVEISWQQRPLCSDGGVVHLKESKDKEPCRHLWELRRAGEGHTELFSEPCLWLKAHRNRYLAVQDSQLALVSWNATERVKETGPQGPRGPLQACWHFGHPQTWTQQHFLGEVETVKIPRQSADAGGGGSGGASGGGSGDGESTESALEPLPIVWLMASQGYEQTLQRLLRSFEEAKEPCEVKVRWVPDMKDTTKEGFILMGKLSPSYRVFYFNYVKFLFLFEALLDALTAKPKVPMVVVMDLDVQVFPNWVTTLRRCLEDDGKGGKGTGASGAAEPLGSLGADVCFLQQAAFGDRRLQQANSGVLVFGGEKGGATGNRAGKDRQHLLRFASFLHALVQRLQAQELLCHLLPFSEPVAFEQLHMNYILNHIRHTVEAFEGGADGNSVEAMRWGIYSPLVAYAGMFLTHAVLTDTVHHATASNVRLKQKLRFLDAAKDFKEDLTHYCPSYRNSYSYSGDSPYSAQQQKQQGVLVRDLSGFQGPLPEFCFYFTGHDPHFGPLLPHHKLFAGFSEEDNEVVLNHLITRAEGRKAWIQLIIGFNEGAYRRWRTARQNTSRTLRMLLDAPY